MHTLYLHLENIITIVFSNLRMLCEERLAEGDVKGTESRKAQWSLQIEEAGMKHLMSVQILEKVLYYPKVYC